MKTSHRLAGPDATPPTPWSYWVVERQLLASAYPGARDPAEHRQKLLSLLDAGIRTIVNLMEESETDHQGAPFVRYEATAAQLSTDQDVGGLRFPIPDVPVPTRDGMTTILDHIDDSLSRDRPVYVHCWGGVGRTGTVVACWMLRHGLATPDNVLAILARLRQQDAERGHRTSPETDMQREFVRHWWGG